MTNKVEKWVRGSLEVELVGGNSATFINEALIQKLNVTELRWTSSNQLQFTISVDDFFKLKKILKPMGAKIRIINKEGFPFLLSLMMKRIWFSIGLATFFVLLGLLSTFIWSIEVEGNDTIATKTILEAAKENGLFPLQSTFNMPDKDKLAKLLMNDIVGVNWIGVEHTGTKVVIKVVEMTLPEQRELQSFRHLVASHDAVISYMVAKVGKPVVKEHMQVRKGDILISGIIGSEQHSQLVVADGEVRGLVWYEYEATIPFKHSYVTYTGDLHQSNFIVIADRILRFKNSKPQYEQSTVLAEYKPLKMFNYELPLGILKEKEYGTRIVNKELDIEASKQLGLEQARQRMLEKAGLGARVISENILHDTLHNGKVVIKVLFEVEQSIAQQKPIVQIQGD